DPLELRTERAIHVGGVLVERQHRARRGDQLTDAARPLPVPVASRRIRHIRDRDRGRELLVARRARQAPDELHRRLAEQRGRQDVRVEAVHGYTISGGSRSRETDRKATTSTTVAWSSRCDAAAPANAASP